MAWRHSLLRTIKRPYFDRLNEQIDLYETVTDYSAQDALRLNQFNDNWEIALRRNPFYREWAKQHNLPQRISSLDELKEFPLLTKADVQNHADQIFDDGLGNAAYVSGGSTGTPTRYPLGESERLHRWATVYTMRNGVGLRPGDPYMHIWGHQHLLGTGINAVLSKNSRRAADFLVGARRHDGYNRSSAGVSSAVRAMATFSPKYIIGYPSFIGSMARYMLAHGFSAPSSLKCIIPTSETLSDRDKADIEAAFSSAFLAMEYGAQETGMIAHFSTTAHRLTVPWDSIFAWGEPTEDGIFRLRVTTLSPRRFPLINYEIGDLVSGLDNPDNIRFLDKVVGRLADNTRVRTREKELIHITTRIFGQALYKDTRIDQVQVRDNHHGDVIVYVTSTEPLNPAELHAHILESMSQMGTHLDPSALQVEILDVPILSRAGKVLLKLPPA